MFAASHLVDCFGMLYVVIHHVTQVFLISIHKKGKLFVWEAHPAEGGLHRYAWVASSHVFYIFYHEIVS